MNKSSKKARPDAQYRERVYRIVRRIPPGRVMTYGQIAYQLGEGYTPRTVGFVMHGANSHDTPWHRVINSQGRCSTGQVVLPSNKQQLMLEAEDVKFDGGGKCDLETYLWSPSRRPKREPGPKAQQRKTRK
jgi:methylated-DNA-protein-cysteine methyltransferase-like protein